MVDVLRDIDVTTDYKPRTADIKKKIGSGAPRDLQGGGKDGDGYSM